MNVSIIATIHLKVDQQFWSKDYFFIYLFIYLFSYSLVIVNKQTYYNV